jgi:hypothetical protein
MLDAAVQKKFYEDRLKQCTPKRASQDAVIIMLSVKTFENKEFGSALKKVVAKYGHKKGKRGLYLAYPKHVLDPFTGHKLYNR